MKRNLILFLAFVFAIFLIINGIRRLITFKGTSEKVGEAEEKLENLKSENERLKQEFAYKKSDQFKEKEIRDKLGLVKEGETLVIVPKDDERLTTNDESENKPNWEKWKELFFGT